MMWPCLWEVSCCEGVRVPGAELPGAEAVEGGLLLVGPALLARPRLRVEDLGPARLVIVLPDPGVNIFQQLMIEIKAVWADNTFTISDFLCNFSAQNALISSVFSSKYWALPDEREPAVVARSAPENREEEQQDNEPDLTTQLCNRTLTRNRTDRIQK